MLFAKPAGLARQRNGVGVPRTPTPRAVRPFATVGCAVSSQNGVGVPRTPTPTGSSIVYVDRLTVFSLYGVGVPRTPTPTGSSIDPADPLHRFHLLGSASPEHRPPRASGSSETPLQHRNPCLFMRGRRPPNTDPAMLRGDVIGISVPLAPGWKVNASQPQDRPQVLANAYGVERISPNACAPRDSQGSACHGTL
jgi:hypothetical protein